MRIERPDGIDPVRPTQVQPRSPSFRSCLAQLPVRAALKSSPKTRLDGIARSIDAMGLRDETQVDTQRKLETQRKELTMATGTVKWFNPTKGYGFIQPQGGGKDVFVHISAVERAGLSTLNEGQTVQFEVTSNRGKESAENLKVG
jgi:CspA family cold shock protein